MSKMYFRLGLPGRMLAAIVYRRTCLMNHDTLWHWGEGCIGIAWGQWSCGLTQSAQAGGIRLRALSTACLWRVSNLLYSLEVVASDSISTGQ